MDEANKVPSRVELPVFRDTLDALEYVHKIFVILKTGTGATAPLSYKP